MQRNVKSLLNVNPHGIWGPPVVEPFLSKWLWNLEECFKTIQVSIRTQRIEIMSKAPQGVLISDIHNRLHQRNQGLSCGFFIDGLSNTSYRPRIGETAGLVIAAETTAQARIYAGKASGGYWIVVSQYFRIPSLV